MKVLLLSVNWVEYLIEMAVALRAAGHEVEVIFEQTRVRKTVGDQLPALLPADVRRHFIDDRPRGMRDPRQLLTIAKLTRLLRTSNADVINLHDATTSYLPLALSVAGRRPLVLTVHDVETHPGHDSREPKRRERVRTFLRERADAVIVHGDSLRTDYLAQPGPICRNVHAIPHGCYTVLRHWAAANVVEIPHSILFFGRIHEYKGLEYLLEAADRIAPRFPDLRIIIAGTGADLERLRPVLQQRPERYIIRDAYLPNQEVARAFQESSIVVLPYIEGSQSGVTRIAYAFGKPVIATRVGSIPESIRDGETGLLIPPRDPGALAEAMASLLSDDDRRQRMAAAAAQMPETEMSWQRIAARTVAVYDAAIRAARSGARRAESIPPVPNTPSSCAE